MTEVSIHKDAILVTMFVSMELALRVISGSKQKFVIAFFYGDYVAATGMPDLPFTGDSHRPKT